LKLKSRCSSAVDTVLTPWPGEAEILLAHVRENDLRGELSFIDKARAVMACKGLLEAERDEPLSQQALSAALMRRGYGLSQAMISHMVYAVERLLPVIPVALEHGIGKPQVQRIRHLDGAAARLWAACGLENELPYDDAFLTLCRRYDGPDWSFDDLEEAVAVEIAEGADRSIQAVRLELRSTGAGNRRSTSKIEQQAVPDGGTSDSEVAPASQSAERAYSRGFNDPLPREHRVPLGYYAEDAGNSGAGQGAGATPPGSHPLKSARARSWALAMRLAKRFGLTDLTIAVPGDGLGYLLIDMPDDGLLAQVTAEEGDQIRAVWQHLAQCCELASAPRERLLAHVSENSLLGQRLLNGIPPLVDAHSDLDHRRDGGGSLWREMDDRAWRDYVGLMESYRLIHSLVERLGVSLWSDQ
jgi:hypothetical protein